MKALTYHGPHQRQRRHMPDPATRSAGRCILRVTATAICGSDLHLYRGRSPARTTAIFSAMNLWEVVEAGFEVTAVRKGDRVVIPL
ncbi:alcohol dehydrogenase catalytic domain-containing protein [Klebsiella variicola subsp. variicola]|nr:alcohol dehydrogenase catalytic domain-containing protein [Klebsiella variicola subsp. variicola]